MPSDEEIVSNFNLIDRAARPRALNFFPMISPHPAHAPHSVPALQPLDEQLHVVTVISNPLRWHSRYRNYREFAKQIADSGAKLLTVECATSARATKTRSKSDPRRFDSRALA
jgi:hypothetical protein